jgi:hypothetical protein
MIRMILASGMPNSSLSVPSSMRFSMLGSSVRGDVRGVPKVDITVGSEKLPESGQVTVISAVYAGGQRPSVVSQARTMAVALPREMIALAARAAPIQLQ